MAGRLQHEIQQKKPFRSVAAEAYLNVIRTADMLVREADRTLKPLGLTTTQYNVLRILRGSGEEGATCSQIGERLVTADPDVTRLLDRLESRQLIERRRSSSDRRVVLTVISREGLALLDVAEEPMRDFENLYFGNVPKTKLRDLITTLEEVRDAAGKQTATQKAQRSARVQEKSRR